MNKTAIWFTVGILIFSLAIVGCTHTVALNAEDRARVDTYLKAINNLEAALRGIEQESQTTFKGIEIQLRQININADELEHGLADVESSVSKLREELAAIRKIMLPDNK